MLSSQLERMDKLHRDFSYWYCLYPVNPHALTKMAGTVNEVYCLILYIPRDISLFKSLSPSWQKVNVSPVCFGAKNNRFGRFHLPAGRLAAIQLVRLYGYMSCYNPVDTRWSYWGCGENPWDELKNQVNVITTSANQIILPPKQFLDTKKLKKSKWHKIPGFNSLSPQSLFCQLCRCPSGFLQATNYACGTVKTWWIQVKKTMEAQYALISTLSLCKERPQEMQFSYLYHETENCREIKEYVWTP